MNKPDFLLYYTTLMMFITPGCEDEILTDSYY